MRRLFIAMFLFLLAGRACTDHLPSSPVHLKVEYGSQVSDNTEPRFSWILNDSATGACQTAWQVLVASSGKLLDEKKADLWNSGRVESSESVFNTYRGAGLQHGKRYYWTVRVWNQDSVATDWAPVQYFDMGLGGEEWTAVWVGSYESGSGVDSVRPRSILLRKEFRIRKKISLAKAYVTGLGSYRFYLNGEKVSEDLLTPGWTDYPTRIMYQVYDVTQSLKKGDNAAGMMLGNVWYSSGLGWQGGRSYSNGPMMGLMQLVVEYSDGSSEIICTDSSWKWHFAPVVENSLYHGETYDARLEIEGWNAPGLDDSDWDMADPFESREALFSAHTSPPIRVSREILPVSVKKLESGSWVFDMGVNMTGGIRLNVSGEPGTEVVMKFAELLHEDGSVAQENLRSAKATDRYILRGGGPETWEPHFTYHGFRYVEISGLPTEPDSSTVTGINFHNVAMETGSFMCSNELLNSIYGNILNGQRSNMFSVPTDCPQRDERLGWMGDAQIFAATSCYNMDMSGFYAKWVRDIYDSQSSEGWVTDVNPAIVVTDPAKPAWGDAYIIVPWELYRFYGDKKILRDYYPGYRAWVDYMRRNADQDGLYIFDRGGWAGYGDWVSVVPSPGKPISAAYYFYSTHLLACFAGILGEEEDAERYGLLADSIRMAFQERFFDAVENTYEGNTQTALLLPVNFGLTPADRLDAVAEHIKEDVVNREYHPSTGFLGTKYLLPTLSDFGYHDVAFRTAVSTSYPSWGYMVEKGATSMWELWNSDTEPPDRMNSRNHFALGSIGEWFYTHLAGIRIDEKNPGFRHSIIRPLPADGLDYVSGSIETPYGRLSSSWKKEASIFTMKITVPPNTTSSVFIPVPEGTRMELFANGSALVKEGEETGSEPGCTVERIADEFVEVRADAGTYTFEILY